MKRSVCAVLFLSVCTLALLGWLSGCARLTAQESLYGDSCNGDVRGIRLWIALGADPNYVHDTVRDPALYCAVFNGHEEAARALLSLGARTHVLGANGTPWNAARYDKRMRAILGNPSVGKRQDGEQ